MSLAIISQGYTNNGIHRVVIRDVNEDNPMNNLSEGYSATSYSQRKKENVITSKVVPFIQEIEKEVKKLPQLRRMKFMKLITISYITILPFLPMNITNAQMVETGFPLLDGEGNEFLPQELIEILVKLILALGTLGVLLAIGCLMVAGLIRMVGRQQKATTLSKDVILGLGQLLLSPVLILILTTIVALLFKNVPALNIFF